MATVSSRFLAIGSGEPNISAGWTIRVLDYKNLTQPVAIVHEFTEFSFTQELNATGQGSITFDEDSPFWTAILNNGSSNRALINNEYVFEAWDNGVPRFAWLAQTVANTIVGSEETRAVTLSGPGIAQVLTWASIMRPGWPAKPPVVGYNISAADGSKTPVQRTNSYQDTLPAFLWRFPVKWPTMRMWWTVFKAAQRRGLIPWVTPMFTALADSAKQPWIFVNTIDQVATKEGYQPDTPSASLLDFLNDCTGQDYSTWFGQRLEWLMYPGFKLDVRRHIGTDRSRTVRFFQGNIVSDERTRDRENIVNRVTVVDVDGTESIRVDAKSVAAWNLREQRNEANKNVTDTVMRNQIADRRLAQSKDEKDEWAIKIPYDDPGRVPYRNFFVGDHIGINAEYLGSTPTAVAAPAKYRVKAITVSVSASSTVPECELTLQSVIDSKMAELEKQITQLINDPVNAKLDDLKDINVPNAPSTSSALVYNPKTKKWEAVPYTGSSGTGGGGTSKIFIQKMDPTSVPGTTVSPGDFWLETYD